MECALSSSKGLLGRKIRSLLQREAKYMAWVD